MAYDPRSAKYSKPQRETPHRVIGGVKPMKLAPEDRHWAAQRWLRLLDEVTNATAVREGLDYADLGQTRSLHIAAGVVNCVVQGRRSRAYTVLLELETIPAAGWDQIAGAIITDASLAAPLLAGELPSRIEDVFSPLKISLFPRSIAQIKPTCDCSAPDGSWCKHVVCAARIASDLFQQAPVSILRLRGLDPAELQERLRRRRAVEGSAAGVSAAYSARVDLPESAIPRPLEQCLDTFWDCDKAAFERVDITPQRPEPTHALLRRLGPSPFNQAPFPLVGLLASAYDAISEHAWREIDKEPDSEPIEEADRADPDLDSSLD